MTNKRKWKKHFDSCAVAIGAEPSADHYCDALGCREGADGGMDLRAVRIHITLVQKKGGGNHAGAEAKPLHLFVP